MVGSKRITTAKWIFRPGSAPIKSGAMLFDEEDTLLAIGSREKLLASNAGVPEQRLVKSALMPGLINCHTHAELGGFERIPVDKGFVGWIKELLDRKRRRSEADMTEGCANAASAFLASGTAHVADTCSSLLSSEVFARSGRLPCTVFREFLGLGPGAADAFDKESARMDAQGASGHRILPSCHAPYSTAPELFRAVSDWTRSRGCPSSVHLAESRAEVELLRSGRGEFPGFLKEMGIKKDRFPATGQGPVQYLDRLGFLDNNTIAVHLVEADDHDLAVLKKRGATPCLCPSSNIHLSGRLPLAGKMLSAGLRPCLGTDSPASGKSLNLFHEIEILMQSKSRAGAGVSAESALEMATINGADALGLAGGQGRLEPGTRPALLCLPCDPTPGEDPLEAALSAGAEGRARWLIEPRNMKKTPQHDGGRRSTAAGPEAAAEARPGDTAHTKKEDQ